MIIQEVYWEDEKILTIIHENMNDKIKSRNIEKATEIMGNKVFFKEFYNEKKDIGNFEYDFEIKGFLDCNNKKNPYNNYSTIYREFINQEDNILIKNKDLLIDVETFQELCKFVKDFSNFNLTPYTIGNLLVFSPIKINVESHNSEKYPYLTIEGTDTRGTAFVKFKLDDIILESYILDNICDGLKIDSKGDWNNYEIEIIDNENIIYKAKYNIIRSINLTVGLSTKSIEKKYQSMDKSIFISNTSNYDQIILSDNTSLDFLGQYLLDEKSEMKKIQKPKESYCNFLNKNQRERAFEIFENIIKENKEMWIFDPFFISDNLGISVLIDILIVLCSTSETKNIVFMENPDVENEEKNMTFKKYKDQIEKHGEETLRDLNLNSLNYIKAKDTFHDRFIFLKSDKEITGYQIGTSLNSFGTNYSNIIKLNDYCAQSIFKTLFKDLVSEEIYKLSG